MKLRSFLWLIALLGSASCGSDAPALDNFEQHLCTLVTDAQGRATTLWLDNGTRLPLANSVQLPSPSDTLRVLAYMVRQADGRARLGHTRLVRTLAVPRVAQAVPSPIAPMRVVTLWRSSYYINVRLEVLAHHETPRFTLTRGTTQAHTNGTHTATLHLCHAPSQTAAYTLTHYLSIDLRPIATTLVAGRDSVALVVHTSATHPIDSLRYAVLY